MIESRRGGGGGEGKLIDGITWAIRDDRRVNLLHSLTWSGLYEMNVGIVASPSVAIGQVDGCMSG